MFRTLVQSIAQRSSARRAFIPASFVPASFIPAFFPPAPHSLLRRHQPLLHSTAMPRRKRQWRYTGEHAAPRLGPRTSQFKMGSDSAPSKRKYYAVRRGLDGFSGVLSSWEECKLYVNGVPDAKFKSFKTLEAAQSFIGLASGPASGRSNQAVRASHTASLPRLSTDVVGDDEVQFLQATDPPADAVAKLEHGLVAKGGTVYIYTDSMYTINGMDSWLPGWRVAKWKTAAGTPVKNKELWLAIDSNRRALLRIGITVKMAWVKGHVGIPGNEAADRLAVAACV
ncbi:unnamed protein product [Agarophyton chilense]